MLSGYSDGNMPVISHFSTPDLQVCQNRVVSFLHMTIMGTANLLGYEAKEFLARALRKAIYGDKDLESMLQPLLPNKKLKLS